MVNPNQMNTAEASCAANSYLLSGGCEASKEVSVYFAAPTSLTVFTCAVHNTLAWCRRFDGVWTLRNTNVLIVCACLIVYSVLFFCSLFNIYLAQARFHEAVRTD